MLKRRYLIAAAFAGSLLAAGGAMAQSQPVVGISTVTTYSADARITAVDPKARTVTFTFANGAVATHKVSPSLENFNARRVGETVRWASKTGAPSCCRAPTPRCRATAT